MKPVRVTQIGVFCLRLQGHSQWLRFLQLLNLRLLSYGLKLLKVLGFHQLVVLLENAEHTLKLLDPDAQLLLSNLELLVLYLDPLRVPCQLSLCALSLKLHSDPADSVCIMHDFLKSFAQVSDLSLSVLEDASLYAVLPSDGL